MRYLQNVSSILGIIVVGACTGCASMQSPGASHSKETGTMRHVTVASESGKFHGWPANNGVWTWDHGKTIVVGFSRHDFVEQEGHNIQGMRDSAPGILSWLARSSDGGNTWSIETPANFVGNGATPQPCPGGIQFDAPGFALRVVGTGYHGSQDPNGSFFVSNDKAKTWQGPYRFGGLMDDPNLADMECTSRTGYVVTGRDSCLVFMSARAKKNGGGRDKSYVAETTDGGKTFRFVTWIVPLSDPYRAVMPAVAALKDGQMVVALRRRIPDKDVCWVDAYGSADQGKTWSFYSRVGETGEHNGNPPALVALKDGRLVCAYGDRDRGKLFGRISADGGKTWDNEFVVRDDFRADKFGDMDFGYPRLVQNDRGEVVAVYYWATAEIPEQHIAGTLWRPGQGARTAAKP